MSDIEYLGKATGKTKKEIVQERLLKAKVIPASELAKQKQDELDRANAFTRAAADEEFYTKTERSVSPNCPSPIGQRVGVITREPFEEQP
jgi:type IV secretory pathway VirD2 relaxase